jgi:hypothetical protein
MMEYIDYQQKEVEAHCTSVDSKARTPNSGGRYLKLQWKLVAWTGFAGPRLLHG